MSIFRYRIILVASLRHRRLLGVVIGRGEEGRSHYAFRAIFAVRVAVTMHFASLFVVRVAVAAYFRAFCEIREIRVLTDIGSVEK